MKWARIARALAWLYLGGLACVLLLFWLIGERWWPTYFRTLDDRLGISSSICGRAACGIRLAENKKLETTGSNPMDMSDSSTDQRTALNVVSYTDKASSNALRSRSGRLRAFFWKIC